MKSKYTPPKLNDRGGDLKKRWFVSYTYRHPITGKMVRIQKYGAINTFKTKTGRREEAKALVYALNELLKSGFNPFEKFEIDIAKNRELGVDVTIVDALEQVDKQKKSYLAKSSYSNFSSSIRFFKSYLIKNNMGHYLPMQIKRSTIVGFLNELLEKGNSNRTRNNRLVDLQSVFSVFVELELVNQNVAASIKKLPTKSVKNRVYTNSQVKKISSYIAKNDPHLHLFISFVTYAFLRPVEVCRLRVGSINLVDGYLTVSSTKTTKLSKRIIIDRLASSLKSSNVLNYNKNYFLFTPHNKPGTWHSVDNLRRDYFSKRFKKIKDTLNLGPEFGLYSFRHTFITNLYRSYRNRGLNEYESKIKLMGITGHKTLDALSKYLREIEAELPDDFSNDFTINF